MLFCALMSGERWLWSWWQGGGGRGGGGEQQCTFMTRRGEDLFVQVQNSLKMPVYESRGFVMQGFTRWPQSGTERFSRIQAPILVSGGRLRSNCDAGTRYVARVLSDRRVEFKYSDPPLAAAQPLPWFA